MAPRLITGVSLSGALPAGLTLSATTGTVSGTPTTSGSFTFTAKAIDSTSPTAQTATKSLTITVASRPVAVQITTSSLPSGQAAVPYSAALAAIDGTSPYKWSITSGALPAGLTLASTGAISGKPTTSVPSASPFTSPIPHLLQHQLLAISASPSPRRPPTR